MSDYFERMKLIKLGLLPKEAVAKTKKPLKKVSDKKAAENKEQRAAGSDDALDKWFESRRNEMKGKCVLCGGKSEKNNDATYRNSIHHIFEKRPAMFPSVSTHDDNWLELCYYGNSCHTNIHNLTITMDLLHDSAEWQIIVTKFKKIYPFIAETERKNIHPLLLETLK
jgi:hypothetical protein